MGKHHHHHHVTGGDTSGAEGSWDFFTNFGTYVPRTHCMTTASGEPDWPWIIAMLVLYLGVVGAYLKIFHFWHRAYLAEKPGDRNRKLMDLAIVFLLCAVCGYGLAAVMFVWPAYRLNIIMLAVLNVFAWRFAHNLSDLTVSFRAKRIERELAQAQIDREAELTRLVQQRTHELQEAHKAAQEASKAKSTFLAHVSHEVRTPLTAILGFADLLGETRLNEQQAQHLSTVRNNAEHLLGVINDLLDVSKIEAGHLELDLRPVQVEAFVRESVTMLSARASAKSIELRFETVGAAPQRLMLDPLRVRQVIANVVGNAVKFTDRGGVHVTLDTTDPSALEVRVRDSGVGISAENLDKLFRPFAQADASTSRRFGGTGLGLVISRNLARMMGGDVTIASTLGEGTVVTIRIAAVAASNTSHDPSQAGGSDAGSAGSTPCARGAKPLLGVRVLVAEDGIDNQRLIRHYLHAAGAEVSLVGNGRLAVEALLAQRNGSHDGFDLVLMDIQMPEMDGYTATRRLRAEGVTTPIIALTAHSMKEDRERCQEAGCTDYSVKPIDRAALINKCVLLVGGRGVQGGVGIGVAGSGGAGLSSAAMPDATTTTTTTTTSTHRGE